MRVCFSMLLVLTWLFSGAVLLADSGEIIKVLPHYLDAKGRHALSPSLYERDAYQAFLRDNPEKRSALRFDIQWKAKRSRSEQFILRLELRSSGRDLSNPVVLERRVRSPRFLSRWSSLTLAEEEYRTFGQLMAWRASLWRGDQLVAEKRSFLW